DAAEEHTKVNAVNTRLSKFIPSSSFNIYDYATHLGSYGFFRETVVGRPGVPVLQMRQSFIGWFLVLCQD
ncbi:MAG: hypothetical protein QGF59_02425, partial [Pirellulaceae bacterium]|nr:hypothetical protein [Pirellulaceae bacterium]